MANSEKLDKVFITLITRNETKNFLVEKTISEESDSQILCTFILQHCDPDMTFEVNKNYELKDGFFIPHFSLVEVENSLLELINKENLNG